MTTPHRARTTVFEAARETWPRAARIVRASPLLLLAALAGTACHTSTPQGFSCSATETCPAPYVCDPTGHCASSCPAGDYADGGLCVQRDAGPQTVSASIPPTGGTVSNSGSSVAIPPGALPANTVITDTQAPDAPPPPNATTVGTPVTFGPEGQQFLVPVTVTLEFDPTALPSGKTAADVVVFTAPVGTTAYTSLGGVLVDATHVSAQTTHFSTFVPGTSSASDAGPSVMAPVGLVYATNPARFTINQAITTDSPSSTGGAVVSYAVSPSLPTGLSLDSTLGNVSGTPTVLTPAANYVVTATNAGGSTTAMLNIAVVDVPPAGLTYATNPAVYTLGMAITGDLPTISGGAVVSWAVTPALPAGLTLDAATGILSGTPTALSPSAVYTVTATNSGGSATAAVTITVNDVAPSTLTYAMNPAVYTRGVPVSGNAPSSAGGPVVAYAITPALPAGLTLDAVTGTIAGTPAALAALAVYTVTATNSGGSTSAALTLTVVDVPPAALAYATNPVVGTLGETLPEDLPFYSGGAVVSWSVSPALPAGLTIDPVAGTLSGTPTALAAQQTYTVTATNSGGFVTTSLTLTVNDVAPSALVYSANPAVYTVGQAIVNDTPSAGGGSVVAYSISPPPPAGLSFNLATGVLSGTPTTVSSFLAYTVTATNSGGATTTALSLTVNAVPPSALTYPSMVATYTLGQQIVTNTPSASGGPVVSYSVVPTLPPGLFLSMTTGAILGTPTKLSPAAAYAVTATNSGGSTTVALNLAVVDVPPSDLNYLTNPAVYTNGVAIPGNTPSAGGGPVVSYSITPALPAGLTLSPTNGVLTGTPTALSPGVAYLVTATNSGGSTNTTLTITVNDAAPAALTYAPNPAIYTKGQTIAANAPSHTGGVITSYSISPVPPAGLLFDVTTGILSGTPAAVTATAPYTVTAVNTGGSTTATLTITVNDVPPPSLTYPANPAVFTISHVIVADAPENSAGVISYAIAPALPAGLAMDLTTGIITGTPTDLSPATYYTVTATNSGGSLQATLSVAVVDVPPSGLTYTTNPAVYTNGQSIANNAPSQSGGGPVVSYAVSPALPTGLSLNTGSGVISGTPTVLSPATAYTVTATNSGGSTTALLTLTVNDVRDSGLAYSANPAVYTLGETITNNVPVITGGAVVSWSISPAPPAGLAFDPTTGILSGTPTALSPIAGYTVTATNSGGTATVALTLTVVDVPPSNLTYPENPAVYTVGQLIANDTPTAVGGAVLSYAITPALPAGLSFSTTNGTVSGTPTVLSAATGYSVTATNSGGSTTAGLTITVIDLAPTGLSYAVSPLIGTVNQAIANDGPTSTGGAVVSYTIAPALPAGLSFSATTGVISGTPTELSEETLYTVTATNSAGSESITLLLTVIDVPPSSLSYGTPNPVYTKGQTIAANSPTSTGGTVVSFSVSPALPAGLSLDPSSGIISGTPAVLSPVATYTVTATNSAGDTAATLSITVIDVPPSNLQYASSAAIYTKGVTITNNVPISSGGAVVSYGVSPALPAGLVLGVNGVISGTPTALSPLGTYVVTATNTGGFTTASLSITVNDLAPQSLTYATNPAVYTLNVSIPENDPSNTGGGVVSYAVTPPLPAGLSLNGSSGAITGTPTVLSPQAVYTVTATGTGGTATVALTLTVNDVAPSSLQYTVNPATYVNGQPITSNAPTSDGGPIVSYTISPALPAGLAFDPATGIVSGTPAAVSSTTSYLVTGTNSGGSTTVLLQITVDDTPATSLTYSTNPAVYTLNQGIPDNVPSATGGGLEVSYAISPALPAGLTINAATGVISGTPTVLSTATTYTVTATNSGGPTTGFVSIAVVAVPPASLTYAVNPAVYTVNQLITPDAASSTGGTVTGFTVSPSLPAGLVLNPSTGAITGTPTALSPAAFYTVTATDSGGSTTVSLSLAVVAVPPTGLTYATNPAVYTQNLAITPDTASTSGGGAVVSYTVTPALPAGLSLNGSTGAISGTPTTLSAASGYTVTATNSGGSTVATLTLSVVAVAPSTISYPVSPAVYTLNAPIAADTPLFDGGSVASWAITPALPSGLGFDTTTGTISGTPTELWPTTVYTVTATNTGGAAAVTLRLTVNDVAPSALSYTSPVFYTEWVPITPDSPLISGGPVVSWSVSPALPPGLSLSDTGVISGTPVVLAPQATYIVTATNSGGFITAPVVMTVKDTKPLSLSYLVNPAVYTLGAPITNDIPSNTGGVVTSYSISPALPAGLSLSATTGVLSGTPTQLSSSTVYTVTASNTGGSFSGSLTLTVNDVAPGGITYASNPAVYTINAAIAPNTASTSSGGPVTSWTISPALPTGLSLDPSAGAISGTPTVLSPTTSYAVTATNSGGSTTATLKVTVDDVVPSLQYTVSAVIGVIGQTITPDAPINSGGAALSYAISPVLPSGLSLDPATGILSGTPAAVAATATYTVTATNSGGPATVQLTVTVNDVAPTTLTYSSSPAVYTINQGIPDDIPTTTGGGPELSWAISPALPTGLSLNPATGVISGTPSVLSTATTYTVTATNSGGPTVGHVRIAVEAVPPANLTYAVNPATYTVNVPIASNGPSSSGGPVVSYTISPTLPAGLAIDPSLGTITGTPTALSATTIYTVTATDSGGSASASLSLTVVDVPPSGLTYTASTAAYTLNQTIAANSPLLAGGGPVISYAINPAPPAGLTFSSTTGVLTGSPTALSAATGYTVTAINSGGSTTATLTLSVVAVPPSSLSYLPNPAVYTLGEAITTSTPVFSGGTASWAIVPALPTGLSFDATTGALSGTPTVLSSSTVYTVTATNTGGSASVALTVTVEDIEPAGLSYATPVVYTAFAPITPNNPTISGGPVVSWTVSPQLPAGLSLSDSGVISGTPVQITPQATYTVTAMNSGGIATAPIVITVNDAKPLSLSYAASPVVYTLNVPITPNTPSNTGGFVTGYTISPALPTGLSLNATTGVVTGTPTALASTVTYTVTASNTGGSFAGSLTITVNAAAPSGLTYSANPAVYTNNAAITPNTPSTSGGGLVTSWTISSALPTGLSFSLTTGAITGTPTALSPTMNYTVTATNSGGSATATLTVTVNDVPPSGLAYPTNPAVYLKNQPITTNTPTNAGGPAVSWSITPAPPVGLSFSSTTGALSGTPTVTTTTAGYAVTATNSGGSATVALTITISDVPPSNLVYPANPATYAYGTAITPDVPTNSGGVATSYSITPSLPAGLSFSTVTGTVSGTPTAPSATTAYSVIATNPGGSTAATLTITVNYVIPSGFAYSPNPATYHVGTPVTSTPSFTGGGPIVSYTITPGLPTGLTLDPTLGVISGTPTAPSALTPYTVKATNPAGSDSITLTLTVDDLPPANLAYPPTNSFVYTKNTAITPQTPTSTGGAITSCSSNPSLPTGLTLSTACVLSGTPGVVASTPTGYVVTAVNSGGQTQVTLTITVNDIAPLTLSYSANPASYGIGSAITPNNPTTTGGAVISYSVSPSLPTGLSLNAGTGVITGTPTVLSAQSTYTVTATNSGGHVTDGVQIAVVQVIPAVTYSASTPTYTFGVPITADTPTNTGGVVASWSVSPPLPAGLSLNTSTGVITGTPTAPAAQATYTVTATNAAGPDNVPLMITVLTVKPTGLSYSSAAVYTNGTPITPNTPSTTGGGPVTSWTISPALPTGLSFSTSTGVISGTPTVVSPLTPYTVTAINAAGNDAITLDVTVNDVPPSVTYSAPSPVYVNGTPITADTATNTGGTVVSWSISPPLPTGLLFSTSTGAITGTPGAVAAAANYVVTATNSGGSPTVTLNITVKDVAPSNLSYTALTAVYTINVAIAPDMPSSSGGAVISYAITPTLPTGLNFNTTTGYISGTPTALSSAQSYQVTATNSGGTSAPVTLNISVVPPPSAPYNLAYSTNPAVYSENVAITPNSPSNSGTAATSFAITPPLPAGLTLSPTTGIITGTPSGVSPGTSYTVTATNSVSSTAATLTIAVSNASCNPVVNENCPVGQICTAGGLCVTPLYTTANGVVTEAVTALSWQETIPTSYECPSSGEYVCSLTAAQSYCQNLSLNGSGWTVPTLTQLYTLFMEQSSGQEFDTAVFGSLLEYNLLTSTPSSVPSTIYYIDFNNAGGVSYVGTTSTDSYVRCVLSPLSAVSYAANPATYPAGEAITTSTPTVSGGPAVSWSITPALPAGLIFNSSTGAISGTPTTVTSATTYTVTASSPSGSASTTLSITVNDAPYGLTYSTNPAVYLLNAPITNNTPSSTGTVTSYAITPALPAGLNFDTTAGIISGTPTATSAPTTYTVTISNSSGSTTAMLSLSVSGQLTATCAYEDGCVAGEICQTNNFCAVPYYTANPDGTITEDVEGNEWYWPSDPCPQYSGQFQGTCDYAGAVSYCSNLSLNGSGWSLPSGPELFTFLNLSFSYPANSVTNKLYWSSTSADGFDNLQQFFGVTATTSVLDDPYEDTEDDMSLGPFGCFRPPPALPAGLTYATNPATYANGTAIADNAPSSTGGYISSWAISPSLPAGLTFSAATGVISGTPTSGGSATYTVTATNWAGSTTVQLTLSVTGFTGSTCSTNLSEFQISLCPSGQICTPSLQCAVPSYTTSNGTVTEQFSGLTWQQSFPNACPSDGTEACTYPDAATYCSNLSLNGGGWALPTFSQAFSLILVSGSSYPGMDTNVFGSLPQPSSFQLWTSTPFEDETGYYWNVVFEGQYSGFGWEPTTTAEPVLCVR